MSSKDQEDRGYTDSEPVVNDTFTWPQGVELLPVIVQEKVTRDVLMLGYMSEKTYGMTVSTGTLTFHSRSRERPWVKGETSGNTQRLCSLRYDCDGDTFLAEVEQKGPACHTGTRTCFDGREMDLPPPSSSDERSLDGDQVNGSGPAPIEGRTHDPALLEGRTHDPAPIQCQSNDPAFLSILLEVLDVIRNRDEERPEGSYVVRLFEREDKMLCKLSEEAAEVMLAYRDVMAARAHSHIQTSMDDKRASKEDSEGASKEDSLRCLKGVPKGKSKGIEETEAEFAWEVADLLFHLLVIVHRSGISLERIMEELRSRRK